MSRKLGTILGKESRDNPRRSRDGKSPRGKERQQNSWRRSLDLETPLELSCAPPL
jgi:hypothetical protein